uniref:KIB1-4 beta-propeller domain-containing protein n=1 Tax=Aegilops tauschii TaxID=37682 RepID=M8BZB7_AEGTA
MALPDWDPPEEKVVICPIAACRGKFYFNSTSTSLDVIDFCGGLAAPVFSSIAVEDTIGMCHGSVFLVESSDQLYMVRLFGVNASEPYHGATVHMMDFSKRQWCEVDDLGGCTFLLSIYEFGASFSGDGSCGLRQDCVYFPDRHRKTLQVFDVKDGSIELQKLDEAPASDRAFWVLPTDL